MAFISTSAFTGADIQTRRHNVCVRSAPVPTAMPHRLTITATAVPRNNQFEKFQAGYLFPEIARRQNAYLEKHPDANVISLGVGDTTMPIPPYICNALVEAAAKLGTKEGYSGYGPDNGFSKLRNDISSVLYKGNISADEIFISDGAKCDLSRLQQVFGPNVTVAVQDPSYPVYVDSSVLQGQTGFVNPETSQYNGIEYLACNAENGFFPDLAKAKRTDIIFFCSPNNPTGAVCTRDQLTELVQFAKKNGSIIVYDAAYAPFINDPSVPTTIYDIEGAKEVAIEINSFSKYAGFTGVRLGWLVAPKEMTFSDGSSVQADVKRLLAMSFNGASNISQSGGIACLSEQGRKEVRGLIDHYLGNSAILRKTMEDLGFEVFGGTDAPYIWVKFPGRKSWDVFSEILEKAQVVTIPGAGFGPAGEGYLRLSAFARREACEEACRRLREVL